ncbi:MAG TPA: YebC/PmpR family DNA-binding transcriptional regulator [Firmicutes bacterium]|jgi:YebC/PmpR family DNA-binding regulatory protein|nr:YebC/PmpR family DNA-binding transcriptional regulator [Bacillota bacterium]
MAGHSKWNNIKHRKAKADAQKGKIFAKVAKEIIVAVKHGGGDPENNFALRMALDKARSLNIPNDNINRAIQRGLGGAEGDNYDEFSYEGFGPGGVAVMVDLLSDNRNRTASDIRHLFSKHGGNMGENGCVAYLFDKKGLIVIDREQESRSEDEMMLLALEAGAEDLQVEEDSFEIITDPADLESVRTYLTEQGIAIASAEVSMIPQTTVSVEGEVAEKVLKLLDALEDHDDVQNVYTNADLPEASE